MEIPACWDCGMEDVYLTYHAYYLPDYAERAAFEWLLIVKTGFCGATKVLMPSCLLGEQGIGGKKKEKIILALSRAKTLQKEIAALYEVSEASVSRLKKEICGIDGLQVQTEIKILEKEIGRSGTPKPHSCRIPAGTGSDRTNALNNLRLLHYYKRLKTQQSPQFKYFSLLGAWRMISRNDRFEFIIRI